MDLTTSQLKARLSPTPLPTPKTPATLVVVPSCLFRAYKYTSYTLGAVVLSIIVAVVALAIVFSNKKFMFTKSLRQALNIASVNDDSCKLDGVNCDLVPDRNVAPPNSFAPPDIVLRHTEGEPQNIKLTSSADVVSALTPHSVTSRANEPIVLPFSIAAAKFAAQLVSISEKAAADHVVPRVIRDDTSVVAHLSGKSANKNINLGWVVKVLEPTDGDCDQLWVAFRGTQTKPEWRQDFQMSQVEMNHEMNQAPVPVQTPLPVQAPLLVHEGFFGAYTEMKNELLSAITTFYTAASAQNRSTTLYITGHSLGAAVALLAVADLLLYSSARSLLTDVRCYAFAAPRVGNNAFVNAILDLVKTEKSVLKEFAVFANGDDIVPSVPLAVQPNLDKPETPWLYAQFPLNTFSANWGSWTHNHTLPVHIAYLNQL